MSGLIFLRYMYNYEVPKGPSQHGFRLNNLTAYRVCTAIMDSQNWFMHFPGSMVTEKSYVGIYMWIVYIYNCIVDFGISVMLVENSYIIINLHKSR